MVLDFFAGSATTLHAVCELNKDDGGSRLGILVTNNENNISRNVAHVRIKSLLTGIWKDGSHEPLPGSLRFYESSFLERKKNPDRMRLDVTTHTVELVSVREMVKSAKKISEDLSILFSSGYSIAVVPSIDADHAKVFEAAEKAVRKTDQKRAYLFTWNNHGIESELAAKWPGWDVQPLPAEMLAELRRLAPQRYFSTEEEQE